MAERSNATSKKNQDAAQDVSTLQKRGRRRLVGAIALVLLAVIVLPMVFDPEPRQNAPTVNIRIPNEEGSKFTPKAAPKAAAPIPPQTAPVVAPEPPKAEPQATAAAEKPVPKAEPKPEPKPEPKAEPKPAEKKVADKKAVAPAPKPAEKAPAPPKAAEKPPAPAPAPPGGQKFVAQVGAFASAEKVKEITDQLTTAKLAHYVETVATAKGPVTRIRLGPFDSKEAAEKARERAKALGLNAANPIAK